MHSISTIIALLGICLCQGVASRLGASQFLVDSEKNKIVDTQGRERFFHGTNVVYKTDPFIPVIDHFDAKESFSVEDADLLASMGFNTIRLGVLWAGLEPVEGEFNMTYLDMVEEIVIMAGERGIYSLLDMHQDAFNAKFCGNGVPDWAAKPVANNFPYPLQVEYEVDENHHPSREDCESISWPNYHFSTALSKSVGRLYDNYEGLLDKFAEFLGKVAERFANSDYVLGYEIMNEPWCGDVFEDPTLLIPGVADRRYLQPVNDRVNEEIRKHDTEHLVFFEAVTWEIVGIGEALGFMHPPGGDDFKNRSVLSFHNSVKSDVTPDENFYGFKLAEIQRLGIAGFVTETNNNGHDVMGLLDDIKKYGWSWQHWAYERYGCVTGDNAGFFKIDGCSKCVGGMAKCLNTDAVMEYTRFYPESVAGDGEYFHFSPESLDATLIYKPTEMTKTEQTVLRVPATWLYPSGYSVSLLSQPNSTSTQVGIDKVISWTTTTTNVGIFSTRILE